MQIGYVGLGKMGFNMVKRLKSKGYDVTAFDVNEEARARAKRSGLKTVEFIHQLTELKGKPRVFWIMVPHTFVDDVIKGLLPNLKKGDIVIDGGNCPYKESIRRGAFFKKHGINFLDVGVSGGPEGALKGACMMVGGEKKIYKKLEPVFKALCVKNGYGYMGKAGSGHFVKMVHNGIEYGMMAAIAEGFAIMKAAKPFKLDLQEVARVYSHGSVIESRLIDWTQEGFKDYGNDLKAISGSAIGTGEGKWTTEAAKEFKVNDLVIMNAVKERDITQEKPSFVGKMIMMMRNKFGGHDIKTK